MSIDPATTYSSNNSKSDSSMSNLESLRIAFAEAIRIGGIGRTSQEERTFFETPDSAQKKVDEDRNIPDRREPQPQTPRRDFTKEDKQTLEKSEVRHSSIDNDYVRKIDRQENIRAEYQKKNERREFLFTNSVSNPLQQEEPVPRLQTTRLAISFTTQSATTQTTVLAPVAVPVSFRVANTMPIPMMVESVPIIAASLPSVGMMPVPTGATTVDVLNAASIMTIFTVTGRFGQIKGENEERNIATEKKKEKKTQVVSLFGQTVLDSVQNQEANVESESETERKSIDVQDDSVRKVDAKNMEESKNSAPHGVSLKEILKEEQPKEEPDEAVLELLRRMGENFVPKQESKESVSKPFDWSQFIPRVSAACQSAANQNGTVRFKLNLDQFGSVTLKITSKSNRLSVKFEAALEVAARIILDNIDELKSVLAEQNIILESVNVTFEQQLEA